MSKFSHFSESDPEPEDDFVAGLVQQMAHSMLEDNEDEAAAAEEQQQFSDDHMKMWGAALHPDLASAPPDKRVRSGWSSNASPSPAVSPPTPLQAFSYESQSQAGESSGDAWELLHMAAQQVMRLKMISRASAVPELRHSPPSFRHSNIFEIPAAAPPPYTSNNNNNKSPCPAAFGQPEWKQRSTTTTRPHNCYQAQGSATPGIPAACAYGSRRPSRSYQQQQQQSRQASSNSSSRAAHSRSSYWASAAALGAANSSGMRAVFLRGPSSTSSGTGVFLPQAAGTGSNRDHNRRPACSTVLLPARIVEVLNLNVQQLKCQGQGQQQQQQQLHHSHLPDASNGAGGVYQHGLRSDDEYLSAAQLSKSYAACSPTRWRPATEHALPTEWTY